MCTGYVTAITNAWRIIPGWPTIQPTPLELFTTTAGGPYDRFTPTASAIVVAWQSTDADILHYLDTARVYLPKPYVSVLLGGPSCMTKFVDSANYSLAYGKPHHHLSESGVIALCVVGFFILFFGISGACIYRARRAQTRAAQHPDGRESEPMQDNNGKRTRFRIIRRMPNPPQPFNGPLPVYSNMMLCGTGQSAASRGQPPDYDDAMKIADAQGKSLRADGSSP